MNKLLLKTTTSVAIITPATTSISCASKELITDSDSGASFTPQEGTTLIELTYDGEDYGEFDYFNNPEETAKHIDPGLFDKYMEYLDLFYDVASSRVTTKSIDVDVNIFSDSNGVNKKVFHRTNIPVDRLPLFIYRYGENKSISSLNDFWTEPHIDVGGEEEDLHNKARVALESAGVTKTFTNKTHAIWQFINAVESYSGDFDEVIQSLDFPSDDPNNWDTDIYTDWGGVYQTTIASNHAVEGDAVEQLSTTFGMSEEAATLFIDSLNIFPNYKSCQIRGYKESKDITIIMEIDGYSKQFKSFLKRD